MSTIAAAPSIGRVSSRDRRNGFIGSYLGWVFDGFETFATVLVAAAVVNDLVGPGTALDSPIYVGWILGITLAAWAVGGLLSGIFADYFGRQRTLMFSIAWYSVCAGLTALAPSFGIFLALRFLTGLGMGAEWGAGSAMVNEYWPPEKRGRGIAFLQGGFAVGFLVAIGLWEVINNGSPGAWRWMYVIGVAPAIITVFVRRRVKDPEMWVEADRRRREARDRARSGAALEASDTELTRFTMSQLLGSPATRKRLGLLLCCALATTLGWWAISTWIPQFTAATALANGVPQPQVPGLITGVAALYVTGGLLGYLALGFIADVIGRKKTMMIFFAGALIMTPILFKVSDSMETLRVLAFINGFFTLGQWTWMALYPAELFPTHTRATAITIVFNATRFLAAAGAVLAGHLIDVFGSIPNAAITFGAIYVLGLIVTPFVGPETKGKPLPRAPGASDEPLDFEREGRTVPARTPVA
jgi:MFS family permease